MKIKPIFFILLFNMLCLNLAQAQSLYCPKNSQYIKPGMSTEQVIQACGQPLTKQKKRGYLSKRIPVTQYIYNSAGAKKSFYGTWQLSHGQDGVQVIVNVVDNKVKSISMEGSASNAFSLCGGNAISVGDPAAKLSACGQASAINKTYINQPTGQNATSEAWVYQLNRYQPSVRLTFVNGKLQSID